MVKSTMTETVPYSGRGGTAAAMSAGQVRLVSVGLTVWSQATV